MTLLLGNDDVQTPPPSFGYFDFDRLFSDDSGENFSLHLVGSRPYSMNGYRTLYSDYLPSNHQDVNPLELSVVVSSQQRETAAQHFYPLYYMVLRNFDPFMKTFDSARVDLYQNDGLYYSTIGPSYEPLVSFKGSESKNLISPESSFLFSSISYQPLQSNLISRDEFYNLLGSVSDSQKKDDEVHFFASSQRLYDSIFGLFDSQDLMNYTSVSSRNRKRLLSEHCDLPVFSYEYLKGGMRDVDKYSQSFLERLAIFGIGSDKFIRDRLTSSDQMTFHAGMLMGSFAGYSLAFNSLSGESVRNFVQQGELSASVFFTGVFLAGFVDGLYRMYKNHKDHPLKNSGIIGGLYERMQGMPFF